MHVETYLNVDFSSSAQVKIQVKFNFKLFLKKKKSFFWFPCCSTREFFLPEDEMILTSRKLGANKILSSEVINKKYQKITYNMQH